MSKIREVSVDERYRIKDLNFWRIIIGFCLASCLIFANLYIVQPLLPEYARDFNISPTIASLSLTMSTISLIIGLLVFGFLSDRIGRLRILHWTLCLSVVPLFFIPLVDSYWWILFWRFMTGFALAGLPAVAVAYISEEVHIKYRGFAVSLYIASNALGGMAGRVIGGYFADLFGWKTTFYALGVIGMIIAIVCILSIPRSRYFQRYDRPIVEDVKGMALHLKNPILFIAFIFGVMLQINFTGIWTFIPFYLEGEPFYFSMKMISLLYLTYALGIIGSPFAGHLASRFGIVRILIAGVLIITFGNILTAMAKILFVIAGLSFVVLGFFIAHSMASTWVGMNAKHHKSGATSLYLVSYYFGVSVAGVINGLVWSHFQWSGIIIVCTGIIITAGAIFYIMAKDVEALGVEKKVS